VGKELRDPIGAARVERRGLVLRYGLHLAEHLRRRGLIEADLRVDETYGLEQVQRAETRDLRRRGRLVEGHADEALRCEVVDLVRLRALQQRDAGADVGEVVLGEF
jgi:hypothetical protein